MSLTLLDRAVTSGTTFTYPDDIDDGKETYAGLPKYDYHMIDVDGTGSAVITAEQGSGTYHAVATLTDESATYLLPSCRGIKIAASGGNITFGIKSYNNGEY